ncbi:MAG TPA: M20/M25/M40 family metallo-hydrolase, partial [Pyrinomonadaceae bacterium]|nr:M20/M25/M40 family metallo-hydrolase [Pyrinomonadaceae bacterium]
MLFLLALAAALAIHLQNRLPQVLPEDAPPSEFSAARALKHLRIVAARPHPIGSQEHAAVRDYILRELSGLGLEAETQRTTAVNGRWGTPFGAGTVENVVARLKGTQGGRALLLVCHYDSVVNAPGASDDGAGVVTLLETARAIKAGPPLKNDIILLFTDGEEVGLLGANAFAAENPLAKEVGLFLNFEARGNSGPVVMFETTGGNGGMIRQLAAAAPRPLANSFFYEIYQRLPNDTDFTVLKGIGAQGMNFAFVNGINHYHTRLDTVEAINPGSLQHEGSYALALARRFGDADALDAKTANAVYFNPLGTSFVDYPGALVLPLLALTALLFGFALYKGIKAGEISTRGVAVGFAGTLAGVVASAALVWLAWWLVRAAQPAYRRVPWGEPYHSNAFRVGLVLLAVAATSSVYVIFRRRAGERGLLAGALICWLILSGLAGVAMPGGSYLFTLPLLFSALGLALV